MMKGYISVAGLIALLCVVAQASIPQAEELNSFNINKEEDLQDNVVEDEDELDDGDIEEMGQSSLISMLQLSARQSVCDGKAKGSCTKKGGSCVTEPFKDNCVALLGTEAKLKKQACKSKECQCCTPPPSCSGKIKKPCSKNGGSCVLKPFKANCKGGTLDKKSCKGKNCQCCIPGPTTATKPVILTFPTQKPTTLLPVTGKEETPIPTATLKPIIITDPTPKRTTTFKPIIVTLPTQKPTTTFKPVIVTLPTQKPTTLKPLTVKDVTPEPTTTPKPVTVKDTTPEPTTTPKPVTVKDTTPEPTTTPKPVTVKDTTPELTTTPNPVTVKYTTPEPTTTPKPVTVKDTTLEPTTTPKPVTVKDPTPEPTTTPKPVTVKNTTPKPTTLKPTTQTPVTMSLVLDEKWSVTKNACIRGNNYATFTAPTIDACKDACAKEIGILCKSMEYNTANSECHLTELSSDSTEYVEPCYANGWSYAEREFVVDEKWSGIRHACIKGNNMKSVEASTIDVCKQKCAEEIGCNSIDYKSANVGLECNLSGMRSDSIDYSEPCYLDGWLYAEKEFAVDEKWGVVKKACIKGNNYKTIEASTIDVCKQKCASEMGILCKSIDYNAANVGAECSLSGHNSGDSDYFEPCYIDGYTYAERKFAVAKYSAPRDTIWNDSQCSNAGNFGGKSLVECLTQCEATLGCTAINHKDGPNPDCVLRACVLPIPAPAWSFTDYKGYSLITSSTHTLFAKYSAPRDTIWNDSQCSNAGNFGGKSLVECLSQCEATLGCTAINHKYGPNPDCVLRACVLPIPAPAWSFTDYKGYSLIKSPAHTLIAKYSPPRDTIWNDNQCSNAGNFGGKSLVECLTQCEATPGCTAINHKYGPNPDCVLRACVLPIPAPAWSFADYKGYSLITN